MGNLWEGEGFFIDVTGMYFELYIIGTCTSLFSFILDSKSSIKMFLVKSYAELIKFFVHLIVEFLYLLSLLLLFSFDCLLLCKLQGLGFLFLLLSDSLFLSFLLGSLSFLGLLSLGFLLSGLLLGSLLLLFGFLLSSFLLSLGGGRLLGLGVGLGLLDLGKSLLLLRVGLVLDESLLFEVKSLLGLHLLLDLQHLELSLGLSSGELVLSLQPGEVCLGSGLLGSSGLGLLDGLGGEELLLHSLSLQLLGGLFLLKFLELSSSSLRENLLLSSLLLGLSDLVLELLVLLDLSLSLLLLQVQLVEESLLLGVLLSPQLLESSALNTLGALSKSLALGLSGQSNSLSVSLLGGFLQGLFHSSELLQLISMFWLLDGLDLHNKPVSGLDVHRGLHLELLGAWRLLSSTLEGVIIDLLQLGHGNSLLLLGSKLLNLLP